MTTYSVADAKNSLPKLIDRALEGEEVIITRHGKPLVEIRPIARRPAPPAGTHAWLEERTRARRGVGINSIELLNQMYESDQG